MERSERKKLWVICGIYAIYVVLLSLQVVPPTYQRVASWDHLWNDARVISGIYALREALSHWELPILDMNTFFGWHLGGDIYSFWSFPNFLTIWLNPEAVYQFRAVFMLYLGCFGAFFYLRAVTKDDFSAFVGGLLYVSTPVVIGLCYGHTAIFSFLMLPLFLLCIHKVIQCPILKYKLLFFSMSVLASGVADFNGIVVYPATIFCYGFFYSNYYCRAKFKDSLYRSSLLALSFLGAGCYYYVPMLYNLWLVKSSLISLQILGLVPTNLAFSTPDFINTFFLYGIGTLLMPVEGNGITFYVAPGFLFFSVLLVIVRLFYAHSLLQDEKRLIHLAIGLLTCAFLMFAQPAILYHPWTLFLFPKISQVSRGVIRLPLNLIPFVLLLTGIISLVILRQWLDRFTLKKMVYIGTIIGIVWLLVETKLLIRFLESVPVRWVDSTNLVALPRNVSILCFFLGNLLLPGLILCPQTIKKRIGNILSGVFVKFHTNVAKGFILALITVICLFYVTGLNEIYYGFNSTYESRSDYRIKNFEGRSECIEKLIGKRSLAFRTLHTVGPKEIQVYNRLSWKNNLELESSNKQGVRVLFSYREIAMPFVGVVLSSLARDGWVPSNFRTPPSDLVNSNENLIKMMAVRYVISAGEPIIPDASWLSLVGECTTSPAPPRLKISGPYVEAGTTFVYEVKKPFSIANLLTRYQTIANFSTDIKKYAKAWAAGIVLINEPDDAFSQLMRRNELFSDLHTSGIDPEPINDIDFTSQSIKTRFRIDSSRVLVFSFQNFPNFRAYLDGKVAKIYEAFGGMMAVPIPSGLHEVIIRYVPYEFYVGILLTFLSGAFYTFLCSKRLRRQNNLNDQE